MLSSTAIPKAILKITYGIHLRLHQKVQLQLILVPLLVLEVVNELTYLFFPEIVELFQHMDVLQLMREVQEVFQPSQDQLALIM